MIVTAVLQIQVMHLLLFSPGRRSKFSYRVWDTSERSKPALILLKEVDQPMSLSLGANALIIGLSSKGRITDAAEQGLSVNRTGFQCLNPV